jgi:hypothetical protein
MMQVQKGNMAEYLLPATLIGLVAVGGLVWSIQGSFVQQGALSLFQGDHVVSASGGKGVIATRSFGANPYLQNLSFTTEKGTQIILPNVPIQVAASLEVDGGHGTVEKFNALLLTLADQLEKSKEIDATQAAEIRLLANRGHEIGADMAAFDQLISQCQGELACYQAAYKGGDTPRGKTEDLHGRLMSSRLDPKNPADTRVQKFYQHEMLNDAQFMARNELFEGDTLPTPAQSETFFGLGLRNFLTQYSQINTQTLSPSVRSVLQFAARQVFVIPQFDSSSARNIALQLSDGKGRMPNDKGLINRITYEKTITFVMAAPPNVMVHQNSGIICATGQGSDSGQLCR